MRVGQPPMTAAPSSPTTRASGAAAARTRSAGPAAAIRSSRTSIDRAGPALAAIVTLSASVSSTSAVQPSTDAAMTGLALAPYRSHPAARCVKTGAAHQETIPKRRIGAFSA